MTAFRWVATAFLFTIKIIAWRVSVVLKFVSRNCCRFQAQQLPKLVRQKVQLASQQRAEVAFTLSNGRT